MQNLRSKVDEIRACAAVSGPRAFVISFWEREYHCLQTTVRTEMASQEAAGPSGLCIQATIAISLQSAGNGHSTNGSGSDTPRRPRKRPRRPDTWRRTVTKTKRAKGEEYVSPITGKTVLARTTGPDCMCKRKCFEKVTETERASVLKQLANKDLQDSHLFGLIQASPVKRRRPRGATVAKTARKATYTYSVSAGL